MKINWNHVIRHVVLRILIPALLGATIVLLLKPKEEPVVGDKTQTVSIISGTPATLNASSSNNNAQP